MKAVINILTNASGLTSLLQAPSKAGATGADAIYIGHAEQNQEPPYITLESSMIDHYPRKDSGRSLVKENYSIFIYTRDYATGNAIAKQVEAALDYVTAGAYNGQEVSSGRLVTDQHYSIVEDNQERWIFQQDFEMLLSSDTFTQVTNLTYANDGQIINETTGFTTMSPTVTPNGSTGTYSIESTSGVSINSSTGDITVTYSSLTKNTILTPTVTFTGSGDYIGTPTYEISLMAFTQPILVKITDETTDLTTGEKIAHIRAPFTGTIDSVVFSCDKSNTPTGSITTFDVNVEGTTIFSTNPTVDAGESTTDTAATAAVISAGSVTEGDEITIDADGVGSTTAGKAWMATINITAS